MLSTASHRDKNDGKSRFGEGYFSAGTGNLRMSAAASGYFAAS